MNPTQLLDGRWDFCPVQTWDEARREAFLAGAPRDIERARFAPAAIHVPGYWNTLPPEIAGDWDAYRNYNYPRDWDAAPAGVYRLRFRIAEPCVLRAARADPGGGRFRLRFDAVAGHAAVWLNGLRLGENLDSFLPFTLDATAALAAGGREPAAEHELIVAVAPPPQRGGHWLQPCGSWVGWHLRGIWQSVRLEHEPPLAIRDIFPQPSVRNGELAVSVALAPTPESQLVEVSGEVMDDGLRVLALPAARLATRPDAETTVTLRAAWPDPRCWSPEDPHLYRVVITARTGDGQSRVCDVRFGFREFWIEGTGFRLNGRPIKLFGDSWHYMGAVQCNPAYARAWYEFAKSIGVNAIRTHAMPYPPFYFDLADELGMVIIDESAIYGSAGTLAFDEPEFWPRCEDHVRRLVRRDRNHPSIVFWSACNETVWKGGEAIYAPLLALGAAMRAEDPTRFVSYDENDSDLGGGSPVHSGHYGTPEHWERVWKRDKPLVIHEFSALYHGGPNEVSPVDDQVYKHFELQRDACGRDAADMFWKLRILGAASITPWNLNWYCLRPWPPEAIEPVSEHVTRGGSPLDRIGAHSIRFDLCETARPSRSVVELAFAPLWECYQPFAVHVFDPPIAVRPGDALTVSVHVFNNTSRARRGELRITFDDTRLHPTDVPVALDAFGQVEVRVELQFPSHLVRRTTFTLPIEGERLPLEGFGVALLDEAGIEVFAAGHDVDIGLPAAEPSPAVLAGRVRFGDRLGPPRPLQAWLADAELMHWIRSGGRLFLAAGSIVEDPASRLNPIRRRVARGYPRGLSGAPPDSRERDSAPWTNLMRDGIHASAVFERPDTGPSHAPLDCGDAALGLAHAPLVVVPTGAGEIVLSGIDVAGHGVEAPVASGLLAWLSRPPHTAAFDRRVVLLDGRGGGWRDLCAAIGTVPRDDGEILLCDGAEPAVLNDPRLARDALAGFLNRGGVLILCAVTPDTSPPWAARLGVELDLLPDSRFNVAWERGHRLETGLNDWDLCWVERGAEQPIVRHTLSCPLAAKTSEPFEPFDPIEVLPGPVAAATTGTRWEGYQFAAEQHKVAMMHRRERAFAGPRAAVIEIPRGRGRIILSQLLLHEARGPFRSRAMRILSRWLDILGAERDPAVSPLAPRREAALRSDGYVAEWLALGPFSDAPGHPLDHPFIDEAALGAPAAHEAVGAAGGAADMFIPGPRSGDSLASRTWTRIFSAFPQVDLAAAGWPMPQRDRVAYVLVRINSPHDRSVLLDAPDMLQLLAGADGGLKVFLNGVVLGRFDFVRQLVLDGDRIASLPLRRGWNALVLKLHNSGGPWRFAARILTATGRPATDLQAQA